MLMLVVTGCGGGSVRGLPRTQSHLAAEETSGAYSLPLVPSEITLNLGQVAPGSQKSLAFWLTNRSAASVNVAEITSSCDCLKVDLPERGLAPGERVEGRIELDLRKEPQFLGKLSIRLTGRGKKGETLFSMEVQVAVDTD